MALRAVFSKLTVMLVIFLMAGKTACRRATITTRVTAFAFDIYMFPGQLEYGKFVVEGPVTPGIGVMAGGTFFSKTTVMKIILLVTCNTSRRCSYKKIIRMTFFTGGIDMRPYQLETCQVVIILGRFPCLGEMAITTLVS